MRGENHPIKFPAFLNGGTSPRARGKHFEGLVYINFDRNIPACAGKTATDDVLCYVVEEHPRVRGENFYANNENAYDAGTSPRARGKHLLTCGSSFLMAILHSVLFFCTAGDSMESP